MTEHKINQINPILDRLSTLGYAVTPLYQSVIKYIAESNSGKEDSSYMTRFWILPANGFPWLAVKDTGCKFKSQWRLVLCF